MNDKILSYRDLKTWQVGHQMVLLVYEITVNFPSEEKFGLISQMRRAAVSVTSCIAEGFSRKSNKDKLNFYKMTTGSLTELDSQSIIARDLKYVKESDYLRLFELIIGTSELIGGLCRATKEGRYKSYSDK